MTAWLASHWPLLVLSIAGASYFGFYVSAARGRRNEPASRRHLEKDC